MLRFPLISDDGSPLKRTFRKQQTIAKTAVVNGFGYWSGDDVRVEFRPAEPDTGIVFVRSDLEPARFIPARVENRVEVPRRTSLRVDKANVEMVEHIMASLAGLQVDNCQIWVDQPEMPGCDGSSSIFVETIMAAGIVEQDAPRLQLHIDQTFRVGTDQSWIEAKPSRPPEKLTEPSTGISIECRIDFDQSKAIGCQTIALEINPETFCQELAPARTFLCEKEAKQMQDSGIGTRTTYQDLLIFNDVGPIENELRYEDECVRHKGLDLVGDLALAGCDLIGHFVTCCAGHRLSVELVRKILAEEEKAVARESQTEKTAGVIG